MAFIKNTELKMKKKNFSETQIVSILKEAESGIKIIDVCRKYGISDATYYNWKSKYSNMNISDIKRLKRGWISTSTRPSKSLKKRTVDSKRCMRN